MSWVVLAVLVLGGIFVAVRIFMTTHPADLARLLRRGGAVALILAGLGLMLVRQFEFGAPLIMFGILLWRRIGGRMQANVPGQQSSVRTAGLEMVLDHATGETDGTVLAGRHEGKRLSGLSRAQLMETADDFQGDADSLRLLEGHLDRAHPGWRDDVEERASRRTGPPPRAGGMGTNEAYKILGLEPGAGEAEVREAHRRLMKQVHPDRGGTAALAAQINEAKDRILGHHR